MWKPALAILARAASCKLPLGNPNFKISLLSLFAIFRFIALQSRPGILLPGFLHSRDRVDFPLSARQCYLFLFRLHQIRAAGSATVPVAPVGVSPTELPQVALECLNSCVISKSFAGLA